MNRVCQHCGELIVGNPYRVTSEEEGITLLDMKESRGEISPRFC